MIVADFRINKSSLNIQKGSSSNGYVGYYAKVVTSTESSDGLYYEDEDKTKLIAYDGRFESIIIPNKVTSIGGGTFKGCSDLKSVVIGTGVLSVGSDAFSGCKSLYKLILLPNSVPSGLYSALPSKPSEGRMTYVSNDNYSGTNYGTIKKYNLLSSYFDVDGVRYVPVSMSERTCAAIDCSYAEDVTAIKIGKAIQMKGIEFKVVEYNPLVLIKNKSLEEIEISSDADIQGYFAKDCSNVTSINLNNAGSIGGYAFQNCTALENLTVGNDVTNIGSYCFNEAMTSTSNGQIILGNTGSVGNYAFYKCTGLRKLTVGETVTNIEERAFYCSMTKASDCEITLNNVGTLGHYCFSYCTGLISASIANTITSMGSCVFSNCSKLTTVNIPSEITVLNSNSFSDCSALQEIVLPSKLKTINSNAFKNSGLLTITIPAATTKIDNGVFNGCKSLASFEAKNGNENLNLGYSSSSNKGLFYDCPLKSVKIGRNLIYNTSSSYGYSPFYRNTALESVTLTNVPTEVFTNEFYGCTSLKNVNIGDGVATIGSYAFSGCSNIETFSFGSSVRTIGENAFSDCTAMTSLYAEADIPPACGSQALDDINKWNCTLYVKRNLLNQYKAAEQWKEFLFVEETDGDGNSDEDPTEITDGSYKFKVEDVSLKANQTILFPVSLKNPEENVIGFQCDITLPEGLEFYKNKSGKAVAILNTGRAASDEDVTWSVITTFLGGSERKVRIIATNNNNSSVKGTDGELFSVKIDIPEGFNGNFDIKLTNILLSNGGDNDVMLPDVSSKLNVIAYTLGDLNDDGRWTITDVTKTIECVLAGTYNPAADMNGDNKITITDVTKVIDCVLLGGLPQSSGAPVRKHDEDESERIY